MSEKVGAPFEMNELDYVNPLGVDNSGGGDNIPPRPEDGGGDDRPESLKATFSGKALEVILSESDTLGITPGEFLRISVKLGILSARVARTGNADFRFETFFHEEDLYRVE